MATYTKLYSLDLTATGDTVYDAITKIDGNVDQVIADLNSCHCLSQGDIPYRSASSMTRLAKGTQGQVLKQGENEPTWGFHFAVATTDSNLTLTRAHNFIITTQSSSITITLPEADGSWTGHIFFVRNAGSGGTVSVAAAGTQLIWAWSSSKVSSITLSLAREWIGLIWENTSGYWHAWTAFDTYFI